jgi:hypothetical protein
MLKKIAVIVVFLAFSLLAACSGGGGGAAAPAPNNPVNPNPGTPQPLQHTVSWLAEGNFWLVSWSEADVNRSWTDVFGDYDTGSYSMKLGPEQELDNLLMYEIILNGDLDNLTPKWQFIGADNDDNIYGKESPGSSPVLLYSPLNGDSDAGFYSDFAQPILSVTPNTQMVPSNFTGSDDFFTGPLTRVGYSHSDVDYDPGGCEYFSGYGTICTSASSGPSTGESHYEYWDAAAGPVGSHYYKYYEDCVGTFCNSRKTERRAIVWSFGDTGTTKIAYQNEPDSYANPTPLPTDTSYFTMIGEVHGNDAPSGYIPGYSAVIGMDLAAEIHDWYAFEVLPGEETMDFIFFLLWNDDSGLDFYLYTAPDNSVYGFLYLAEGVLQNTTANVDVNHASAFSGTFLAGKYLLGVKRTTAPNAYASGYGVMVIRGEDLATPGASQVQAPGQLAVNVLSTTQVALSWTDHSDNETGFIIERSTDVSGPYVELTRTGANVITYEDAAAQEGNVYYYRVRAYATGIESANSNTVTASTVVPPALAPPSVINVTSTSATLNWSDVDGETGYEIRRCDGLLLMGSPGGYACMSNGGIGMVTEAAIAVDTTTYAITGLNPGSDNVRWLRAVNGNIAGNATAFVVTTPL